MTEILDLKDEADYLFTLARWHQNEWSYLNPGQPIEQRITKMQSHLNHDFIPSTFIAKDKTVIGSASIVASDMETRPLLTPWLASVFVVAEHRRRGIGSKLVLHIMAQAKIEGIKTLYLFTPDKKDFYQKLGWRTDSITDYHGHPVTIMQVTLNDK